MTTSNEHNNAPAVPQGWAIKFEGNDISVSNDHMGCIVPHTETVDRKMPSEVLHALCRDLLAATKSTVPAVPQGWKLVPVEPTEAMSIAGGIAWESSLADDVIGPLEDAWAAMLAATPAPAPAQEVATLPLSAEDVHAAFTKNFPKSRISQAWINFAADIAQAIAARAAKPAQEAGLTDEWAECKRISELPEVDEALRLFAEGETSEDQAVAIVQTIAQALRAKGRK